MWKKLLISWDFHFQQSQQFTENGVKDNIQGVAVLWVKTPCWWETPEEDGQTGLSWQEESNWNNYVLQNIGFPSTQKRKLNWSEHKLDKTSRSLEKNVKQDHSLV